MPVGFYVDYQPTDECLAALQLAFVLEGQGHTVEVCPAARAGQVWHHFDGPARRPRQVLTDWVKGLSHVVFCRPVQAADVRAVKAAGSKAYLLCGWSELAAADLAGLSEYDRVVCPSKAAASLVKASASAGVSVVALPWVVTAPQTRSGHQTDPRRLGVAWALDGTQPLRQSSDALDAVKAAAALPNVYVTVLYSSRLPEAVAAELRQLAVDSHGRVSLVRGASWERQLLTLAAHDLTFWPTLCEDFGLPGLMSLAAGTPVLAFDHPVVGEVVHNEVSGRLVPCELTFNWLGVPTAAPAPGAAKDALLAIAADAPAVARMRARAHHKAEARRAHFAAVVEALFNP